MKYTANKKTKDSKIASKSQNEERSEKKGKKK